MQIPEQEVTYIDNPHCPSILVDAAVAVQMLNGLVRLTLGQWHTEYGTASSLAPLHCVCVAKIAMTLDQAEYIAKELLGFVAQQRAEQVATPVELSHATH